jgi:hypothetical protein
MRVLVALLLTGCTSLTVLYPPAPDGFVADAAPLDVAQPTAIDRADPLTLADLSTVADLDHLADLSPTDDLAPALDLLPAVDMVKPLDLAPMCASPGQPCGTCCAGVTCFASVCCVGIGSGCVHSVECCPQGGLTAYCLDARCCYTNLLDGSVHCTP